jgi:hypothetical protein
VPQQKKIKKDAPRVFEEQEIKNCGTRFIHNAKIYSQGKSKVAVLTL